MRNLTKHMENGIVPRCHGNPRRLPKHVLSMECLRDPRKFLLNYAEQNALLLPGRVPGFSRTDIRLLPSSTSKRRIWKVYKEAMERVDSQAVAYTTFCRLWQQLTPYLVLMKQMTDLCWECQKNSAAIQRAIITTQSVRRLLQWRLPWITWSWSNLRGLTTRPSVTTVEDLFWGTSHRMAINFQPPPLSSCTPPNSNPIEAHYSFDYAQQVSIAHAEHLKFYSSGINETLCTLPVPIQVHYPSNPLQPGPIYFLTPRKCALFGVNCEALPRQVNFLCDEAGSCGKGANTVVSQLHYFFEHHGL